MSQELYGHSANRGDCIQPCRRNWEITARDTETNDVLILGEDSVLSPKDLCSLPFLNHLVETGVDSIKIEGRKRSPKYLGKIVSIDESGKSGVLKVEARPLQTDEQLVLNSEVNGVEFFQAELSDAESASQGETVRINLPKPLVQGDQIYAWVMEKEVSQ